MHHLRLLSIACILVSHCAFAQRLTPEAALSRALGTDSPCARRVAALKPSYALSYASDQLYAFSSDDGFLLCPADERFPALLGYSDEGGSWEGSLQSEHFQLLLTAYEQAIARTSEYAVAEGQIFKPTSVQDSVPPLLTDLWEQYAPYYRRCPLTDEGDTCCVGCVALAMGEVMRYWQWPAQGTGSHTYFDEYGLLRELTADFSAHTYDYAHMLDEYSGTFTDEEADAVALLLSDCGVAVNMRYGTGSSAAACVYQPQALHDYFGYDEAVQLIYRGFFPQQEWDSIMFTELSEGRPLLVAAHSLTLSHALVCDGYDADGYFHMVFGNEAGDANGYYYFTWLTPQQPDWYDLDSPERGLNLLQSIVRGIQPETGGTSRHFYGFSHMDVLGQDADSVQVEVACLGNLGWQLHDGTVGLALKALSDPDTTLASATTLVYTYPRQFALEEVDDTVYTDTIALSLSDLSAASASVDGAEEGARLVPVFEQDGTFIEARTMVGTPNYLCYANGVVSASTDTFALVVSDVVFPDSVILSTKPAFSFTITNTGAEYSGRLYVGLVKDTGSDLTSYLFAEVGLSLLSGETTTRTFHQTTLSGVATGTNYLRILADVDLFTDSLVLLYEGTAQPITVLPSSYTSVEEVEAEDSGSDSLLFDLSGRRLLRGEALQPGIYILDGKKIILY